MPFSYAYRAVSRDALSDETVGDTIRRMVVDYAHREVNALKRALTALLYLSRFFGMCALVVGIGAGLLVTWIIAALTCFDNCPAPDDYFSHLVAGTTWVMQPFLALVALSFVTFVAYCLVTGRVRRAAIQTFALLIGALISGAALYGLFQLCQMNLPVTAYGQVDEEAAVAWMRWWGLALVALSGAWSGVLVSLQWTIQ